MSFTRTILAASAALTFAMPALADGMLVHDAYFRTSGAMAKTGAAFMHLMNETDQDDRLIAASSDLAKRVELHTHIEEDGIMKMREVEGGFAIPAGGMHELVRGGDHVMFMGLTRPVKHGDMITLTLTFEHSGDITLEVPVDLERRPGMEMQHQDGAAPMTTESDS